MARFARAHGLIVEAQSNELLLELESPQEVLSMLLDEPPESGPLHVLVHELSLLREISGSWSLNAEPRRAPAIEPPVT